MRSSHGTFCLCVEQILVSGISNLYFQFLKLTGYFASNNIMANSETTVSPNDVFADLDVDQLEVNEIESLCFNCGENVSIHITSTYIFD